MWKYKNFYVIQFIREIDFGEFETLSQKQSF